MSSNEKQPELFQNLPKTEEIGRKKYKSIFKPDFFNFSYSFTIEQIVIILIFAVMINIISFSAGTERGRKHSVPDQKEAIAISSQPFSQEDKKIKEGSTVQELNPSASAKEEKIVKATKEESAAAKNPAYTIQVATFKNRDLAEKEQQRIGKKGYSAIVVVGEKYFYVRIGEFSNKSDAEKMQSKLKQIYKDCFIKKL